MKTATCPKCGAPFTEGANFCGQCGTQAPVLSASELPPVVQGPCAEPDPSSLEWQADMTLLTNRFFLGDMARCFGITLLVFGAFIITVFGMSGGQKGIEAGLVMLLIPAVLMVLGTLVFIVIMGNRVPMGFLIDGDGVRMRSISKRVKGINNTAIVLGLLAGKHGAVGAGALGRAQENCSIAWNELCKVRFYPAHRVIFLKGGFLSRIRVYCTPQNYPDVEQRIRSHAPLQADVATL